MTEHRGRREELGEPGEEARSEPAKRKQMESNAMEASVEEEEQTGGALPIDKDGRSDEPK